MATGTPRILALWLGGAMVLALTSARAAEACSCVGTYSGHQPCQVRWTYAAVFVGRVTSIDPGLDKIDAGGRPIELPQLRVHFAVSEPFSGVITRDIDVSTGRSEASCGFGFALGGEYLVYASRRPDGSLSTGICSPTKKISDASTDLAYLRSVPAVAGRVGRLIGLVIHAEPSVWIGGAKPSPMGGVRVVAEGQGLIRSAVTKSDGAYEIEMPPGRYVLRAEAPAGMTAAGGSLLGNETELKDARGCAVTDFSVRFDGHISAKVVTTSGAPVPFLPFSVRATDARWPAPSIDGRMDADGRVEIAQVPQRLFTIVTPPALGAVSSRTCKWIRRKN